MNLSSDFLDSLRSVYWILVLLGGVPTSLCHFHPSVHPSVCRATYLRNCTSSGYPQAFIYLKFWFSGLLGGKRAKNIPKWKKKQLYTSVACYISRYIQALFHYFFSFDFLGCQRGKRERNSPKQKITFQWSKLCSVLSHNQPDFQFDWTSFSWNLQKWPITERDYLDSQVWQTAWVWHGRWNEKNKAC